MVRFFFEVFWHDGTPGRNPLNGRDTGGRHESSRPASNPYSTSLIRKANPARGRLTLLAGSCRRISTPRKIKGSDTDDYCRISD